MIINEDNIEKAKNLIKKGENPIIVQAKDDIFNRKMLEYGKFEVLLSPESGYRKDKLRKLDSGLNEIMARIAAKNKISIGIDISEISKLNKKDKAIRLSKIAQNIRICRKSNTSIKVINSKDKKSAFAMLITLGASTKQAKQAF